MKLKLRIIKQDFDEFSRFVLQEESFWFLWRDVTYKRLKKLSGFTSLISMPNAIVKSDKEESLREFINRIKNNQKRKNICDSAEVVYQEEI